MNVPRRKSESPLSQCGSCWSLPEAKNPLKILSRSVTSDTLLRNIERAHSSSSSTNSNKTLPNFDYREIAEKYIVKQSCGKATVSRQHSDLIFVRDCNFSGSDEHVAHQRPSRNSLCVGTVLKRSSSSSHLNHQTCTKVASDPLARSISSDCHKLLESVVVSDKTSAFDGYVLCKLNVQYVLNTSNCSAASPLTNSLIECPCGLAAHSRCYFKLSFDDSTPFDSLFDTFNEATRLIHCARSQGRKVFIFDSEGLQKPLVLTIQYVMQYFKITYAEAREFLRQTSIDEDLKPNYENSLKAWETKVFGIHQPKNGERCKSSNDIVTPKSAGKTKHFAWN